MMTPDAKYAEKCDVAIALLRGSTANFALCCISMTASFVLAVVGILLMTGENGKRVLAVQSIVFLVAQAFTLTRVSRDWATFEKTDIAKPTAAYFGQVVFFFLAALGLSLYSLVTNVEILEWQGFYAMSVLWGTVSALCLSKAVRDRNDANISSELPLETRKARLPEILRVCRGTVEYKIFVWMSALFAVGLMLGLMWTWDAEVMVVERKGFVSVCVLWCEASSFHLAKLVRDRNDPMKAKELKAQFAFQILVGLSSVLSFCILVGGICIMPLDISKKMFLVVGCGLVLSTAFFLAKHVRDSLELQQLLASPEVPDVVAAAPVTIEAPEFSAAGP